MTQAQTSYVVADASAVVGVLLEGSRGGDWAASQLRGSVLAAPHLMPFEVAHVLRRHEAMAVATRQKVEAAYRGLQDLPVMHLPFALVAERVWELRENLSAYDASYVALAELLTAPLVTLDSRIARSPLVGCEVIAYPGD